MTREELEAEVKALCPEMLSHEHFMHVAECVFCKGIPNDTHRALDDDEFESWHKLSEKLHTATVGQVIKYLQDNFKLDNKLCYMNYVQGCKNDCAYMTKDQLGNQFFKYVKQMKDEISKDILSKEDSQFTEESVKDYLDDNYPYVNDNDVIIC